jgi:hypothetical protein
MNSLKRNRAADFRTFLKKFIPEAPGLTHRNIFFSLLAGAPKWPSDAAACLTGKRIAYTVSAYKKGWKKSLQQT